MPRLDFPTSGASYIVSSSAIWLSGLALETWLMVIYPTPRYKAWQVYCWWLALAFKMPFEEPANTTETKSQPWRAVWPAPESRSSSQLERKAGTNNGGNGLYGYNDKNEGVACDKAFEKK
ncbi:hypothetical protein BDZ45DRAFT_740626 [Acephala macrosclerotiorum]|nr:hypothetical protein BDZ45DRAFT_740626 [Acephala macrosclerotiorum]